VCGIVPDCLACKSGKQLVSLQYTHILLKSKDLLEKSPLSVNKHTELYAWGDINLILVTLVDCEINTAYRVFNQNLSKVSYIY
jgi:hypothetical protein